MSTWNFRVMRHFHPASTDPEENYTYRIHEVYYDEDGKVTTWTQNPSAPFSLNILSLDLELKKMSKALTKPVLDYGTGKEI